MMTRYTLALCCISACALLLSACASENPAFKKLRYAKTTSDVYGRTLAKGYEAYALDREKDEDYTSANYFADKGLKAAYGEKIDPEAPAKWELPKSEALALTFSRERLMKALAHPHIGKEPARAAEAVLSYDCWIDQQSSGRDANVLSLCQQEYFEQIAALNDALMQHEKDALAAKSAIEAQELAAQEAAKAKEAEAQTEPVDTAAPNYEPVPIESTSTIIYFPFDSDRPGEVAGQLLDELIRYILGANNVQVLIHGHTDRAGSEAYNLDLSERRAEYVRSRLVEAGVNDKHIEHYGFGESDPKVPTEDGVREPYNRRVEIFIE